MIVKKTLIFCLLVSLSQLCFAQDYATLTGVVKNQNKEPLVDLFVSIQGEKDLIFTDQNGKFTAELEKNKSYQINLQGVEIQSLKKTIFLRQDTTVYFEVSQSIINLPTVDIETPEDSIGKKRDKNIEEGWIYEGKKRETIDIDNQVSNKATNNARQAFKKIPSLNIWESDNAGLQLDIGGRGLSPRRTTNFNTRQNGYDISADPLGYPESYYTPPLQAVEKIEVVRGAGALQYGSQFGGLINFKLKRGDTSKAVNVESHNTYGAYKFFNTFNSVHGQVKKLNYYTYVQHKRGDGWRENSTFNQYGAFASLEYQATKRFSVGLDYTFSHYISQQAGGLTDEAFATDPRSSTRDRNWFRVNWNLGALQLKYILSERLKIYNKSFLLAARRTSLGTLELPSAPDGLGNRDLLDGVFRNVGNETRAVFSYYGIKQLKNSLLFGARVYKGFTNFSQKFGTDGTDRNFVEVDTSFLDRTRSDFDFPSFNTAIFAENIIRLSKTLSVVPGFRYEYISTESDGFFTNSVRTNSFGDFVEEEIEEDFRNERHIFLYGVGISKLLKNDYEFYANATSNYRAINFTDVRVQTNTQLVDTLIRDESGYNFDIGIKRKGASALFVEGGFFYTVYNDRIGQVRDDGLIVRTNIGSARIFGVELLLELKVLQALKIEGNHQLSTFINGSVNRGVYTEINQRSQEGVRSGNRLEDLPNYNIKYGITYKNRKFSASVLASFVGDQFSDAANSTEPFEGIFGIIPAYEVVDLSAKYNLNNHFTISSSINNLLNRSYFTRRALAYPGPGIIPAQVRTWNITATVKL